LLEIYLEVQYLLLCIFTITTKNIIHGIGLKKMKIAKYMRYSTDKQELKVQKEEIDKYVNKLDNVETQKDYVDAGMSGKDLKRAKFEEMKNDILAQKINTVVVLKLDRLSRSVQDLILTFEFFNSQEVQVIVIKDNIDTSSAHGKLMFHILGAFAEFERNIIRERLSDGRKYAREHGTKSGKPMNRPKIEFNIREAKRLREMGLSYRKIAKQMNIKSGITIKSRIG